MEVEGEALRALEFGQPDVAGRARLVAPHHLPAVALRSHPKVLRVRPAVRKGRVTASSLIGVELVMRLI